MRGIFKSPLFLVTFIVSIAGALFALNFFNIQTTTKPASASTGNSSVSTQAEWELGARSNIDSTTTAGAIKIDDKISAKLTIDPSQITMLLASETNKGNTVDGDWNSSWIGNYDAYGHDFMQIDLGSTYSIGKILSKFTLANFGAWSNSLDVYISANGTNWTLASPETYYQDTVVLERLNPGQARYIKLFSPNNPLCDGEPAYIGVCAPQLYELEVHETDSIAVHTSASTQFDAGAHDTVNWTTFVPTATSPENTAVKFRFRTSPNASTWSAWSAYNFSADSIDLSGLTQQRYLQVETTLTNSDGLSTPTVDNYTANFDYTDAPAETCSDGIQNQGETGVDCGGPCSACPATPTCEDGIQNGDETGVDCGGACNACAVPETCSDGILNQNETNTDCGGVCQACPIPPTCSDGIQNGTETGIDCGGSCAACPVDPCQAAGNIAVKTLSPNGGESYQLTGQMNLSWMYGDGATNPPTFPNLSLGQKSQISDVPLGVVLSADGGNTYGKLLSILFPDNKFSDISTEGEIYVREAANKYGGLKPYTTRNKYVASLIETQGYYTYSLTIPNSETLVTNSARVKLVPLELVCRKISDDASDNNFKITAKTIPSVPKSITISVTPDPSYLRPSQTQQYTARVVDQDNKDITGTCPVTWSMQTPSAGSINSGGLLTTSSSLGTWNDAIKAEAKCAELTDFSLLSFATTNEARRLAYVWANPWSAAVQEPTKNTSFDVWGYDQFNLAIKSGINYSFSLLDKRIGTIPANGRAVNILTSNNYGCYLNKVQSTATYEGITKSSYGSIAIYPAKLSLTNGCGNLSAKIFTALTGIEKASAAEGQVFSYVTYAAPKYLRSGQTAQFAGVPRDQSWTPIGGVKVEYILKDSNAGQLASNGKFIAGSNPGSYFGAIEIRATKGDKVISETFDVIVTAEKRKAGSIHAWGATGASELYSAKVMKLSKTGYYSFYSYLKDQFGDVAAGNFDVKLEDVSGHNLIDILGPTTIHAKGKEGVFKNALKVTYDVDSLNSRITEERDRVEGPSPIIYLTLDISDKNDDPSSCIKNKEPLCDPLDPECVAPPCTGKNCTSCIGNECDPCLGSLCSTKGSIGKISGNSSALSLILAALLSMAIGLFSALTNGISLIRGSQIFSFFAKGVDKKNAKGTVYDAFSGLPIPNARILLLNDKKGVDSIAISGREGKFALPLNPGQSYIIKIEKEGFSLFDDQIREQNGFLKYELKLTHNYFGEEYLANSEEFFFSKNIPLIPNADSLKLARKTKLWESLTGALMVLNSVIIFIGSVFSIIALYVDSSRFNILVFGLYILLLLFYAIKHFYTGRSYGMVRKSTGEPVELALVRVLRAKDGRLFKTVATDKKGRFGLALPKGYYKIYCSKQGLKQKKETDLFVKSNLKPTKLEIIVETFEVGKEMEKGQKTHEVTKQGADTPEFEKQAPETYPHFDQPATNTASDYGYSEVDLNKQYSNPINQPTLSDINDDRYAQDASQIIENYKAL